MSVYILSNGDTKERARFSGSHNEIKGIFSDLNWTTHPEKADYVVLPDSVNSIGKTIASKNRRLTETGRIIHQRDLPSVVLNSHEEKRKYQKSYQARHIVAPDILEPKNEAAQYIPPDWVNNIKQFGRLSITPEDLNMIKSSSNPTVLPKSNLQQIENVLERLEKGQGAPFSEQNLIHQKRISGFIQKGHFLLDRLTGTYTSPTVTNTDTRNYQEVLQTNPNVSVVSKPTEVYSGNGNLVNPNRISVDRILNTNLQEYSKVYTYLSSRMNMKVIKELNTNKSAPSWNSIYYQGLLQNMIQLYRLVKSIYTELSTIFSKFTIQLPASPPQSYWEQIISTMKEQTTPDDIATDISGSEVSYNELKQFESQLTQVNMNNVTQTIFESMYLPFMQKLMKFSYLLESSIVVINDEADIYRSQMLDNLRKSSLTLNCKEEGLVCYRSGNSFVGEPIYYLMFSLAQVTCFFFDGVAALRQNTSAGTLAPLLFCSMDENVRSKYGNVGIGIIQSKCDKLIPLVAQAEDIHNMLLPDKIRGNKIFKLTSSDNNTPTRSRKIIKGSYCRVLFKNLNAVMKLWDEIDDEENGYQKKNLYTHKLIDAKNSLQGGDVITSTNPYTKRWNLQKYLQTLDDLQNSVNFDYVSFLDAFLTPVVIQQTSYDDTYREQFGMSTLSDRQQRHRLVQNNTSSGNASNTFVKEDVSISLQVWNKRIAFYKNHLSSVNTGNTTDLRYKDKIQLCVYMIAISFNMANIVGVFTDNNKLSIRQILNSNFQDLVTDNNTLQNFPTPSPSGYDSLMVNNIFSVFPWLAGQLKSSITPEPTTAPFFEPY
jgi:hypothetical protein